MKAHHKTLLLWVLLIMMFLAIWQFLSPERPPGAVAVPETTSAPVDYLPVLWIGGLLVAVFLLLRRVHASGKRLQEVLDRERRALEAEDYASAAAIADEVPRWPRINAIYRASARANALYLDGRFEEAVAALEPAIGRGIGVLYRKAARSNELLAIAKRAVLRAASDDAAGMRADVERIRSEATAHRLGRGLAAFAELVAAARAEDFDAARAKLEEHDALFRIGLARRERVVVDGIARLATPTARGVYRVAATDERDPGSPAFAAWVRKLVPAAGAHVAALAARTELAPLPKPSADATRLVAAVRNRDRAPRVSFWRRNGFVLAAAAGAIGWGGGSVLLFPDTGSVAIAGPITMAVLVIAAAVRRGSSDQYAIQRANERLAAFDLDEVEVIGTRLAQRGDDGKLTTAHRLLAEAAYHRGERGRALEHADLAIAALTRAELAARSDTPKEARRKRGVTPTVTPIEFRLHAAAHIELAALRAQVLTSLGRDDEAAAELGFISAPPATLRYAIELLRLARQDPHEGARLAARRGLDLDIIGGIELLGDVLQAADGDAAAARDVERALRASPAYAGWLDAVAPGLLARSLRRGALGEVT